MTTCIVRLDKKFASPDALLTRLKVEINMLQRLKVHSAKVVHGSGQDARYVESRLLCRQYLHELLAQGSIRALCVGEHFGPFEREGQQLLEMNSSFRNDPDWSRRNDAIVMLVL